jgi:uncharacterized protein YndB with AHSA1/START domain
MTERSITHSTFTLERDYAAPVARLWQALTVKEQKAKWFGDVENQPEDWTIDFREGGREYSSGEFHGAVSTFDATYLDIVEHERIVISYTLQFGDDKLSASLQSIQLEPSPRGTRLLLTEHGAYFDGHDDGQIRKTGTAELLETLGALVESAEG